MVNMNSKGDDIDKYDEMVSALAGIGSYTYALKKLDLDIKNRETPPATWI